VANKWRGFIRESVDFIDPRNRREWISFILYIPIAAAKFYWLIASYTIRRYYYVKVYKDRGSNP
jgi:hypothetical protein